MKRTIFSLLLLIFFQVPVCAQQKFNNEVSLQFTAMRAKGWVYASDFPLLRQIGITYGRRVYKSFFIGLEYTQWSTYGADPFFANGPGMLSPGALTFWGNAVGDIHTRHSYKMVDVPVSYKLPFNHQCVTLAVAPFFAFGYNSVIEQIAINEDGFKDVEIYLRQEDVKYWGLAPEVSYHYSFLKDRLDIGAHFTMRKFFNTDYLQEEMGIKLGVNF